MSQPLMVRDLKIQFGKKQPLFADVSLTIGAHEIVTLMGENGVGKTTLLECLMGLRTPASGSISFWGQPIHRVDNFYGRVGWVTSSPEVYPYRARVGELFQGLSKQFVKQWNQTLVENLLDRLHLDRTKRLDQLSLGEKSKVRLIKALAFGPELLLLDELTANLSPESKQVILAVVLEQFSRVSSFSVLYVCHSRDEAIRLSDRVLTLRSEGIQSESESVE